MDAGDRQMSIEFLQHRLMRGRRRIAGAGTLAMLLLAGCASGPWAGFPQAMAPGLTWPAPPEQARIGYLVAISEHRSLFEEAGAWRSLKRWLGGASDSRMLRPYALALHPAGGLLVTDPGRARVHFYDWGRRRYVALGEELAGGLPSPVGVAALPDGRVLVSDSRLERVLLFDTEGAMLGDFTAAEPIGRPAGLAVDAARGEVYLADVTAHQVRVYDFGGRELRALGSRGGEPGQFNFPTHLALGPDGRLAVTDSMNFRVQVIEPDGRFVRMAGMPGDAPGGLNKPKGVAVDAAGRVMVMEGLYDALQVFDTEGRLLLSVGSPGSEPGEFWLAAGLAYDGAAGRLFVADSYNGRVQVFKLATEGAVP